MAVDKVTYQNLIDIGIFILFLDLCLSHNGVEHSIEVCDDYSENEAEMTLACKIVWC